MAERIEIRAKRWKLWLFLVGTLAFGAVGLVQIVLEPPGAWYSWASLLFFGVLGTISFTRQLRAKRAPLAFDADGIEGRVCRGGCAGTRSRKCAERPSSPAAAGRATSGAVPKEPQAVERNWNAVRRLLARADERVVGAPINFPTKMLERSQSEILDEIRRVTAGRVPVRDG